MQPIDHMSAENPQNIADLKKIVTLAGVLLSSVNFWGVVKVLVPDCLGHWLAQISRDAEIEDHDAEILLDSDVLCKFWRCLDFLQGKPSTVLPGFKS